MPLILQQSMQPLETYGQITGDELKTAERRMEENPGPVKRSPKWKGWDLWSQQLWLW